MGKLDRFIQLTVDERKGINIVCLASNPNGRGLDFWFEKKDIYEGRSRIGDLKKMTNQILTTNTKKKDFSHKFLLTLAVKAFPLSLSLPFPIAYKFLKQIQLFVNAV